MFIILRDGETKTASKLYFNRITDAFDAYDDGKRTFTIDPVQIDHITDQEVKVTSLLQQAREYVLSTWSKGCTILNDDTHYWATNGRITIRIRQNPGATPFLEITQSRGLGTRVLFDGYFRNIEDFKTLLELTSVQLPT
jgi:hypothetical protein